jgi:hypothetical protein
MSARGICRECGELLEYCINCDQEELLCALQNENAAAREVARLLDLLQKQRSGEAFSRASMMANHAREIESVRASELMARAAAKILLDRLALHEPVEEWLRAAVAESGARS